MKTALNPLRHLNSVHDHVTFSHTSHLFFRDAACYVPLQKRSQRSSAGGDLHTKRAFGFTSAKVLQKLHLLLFVCSTTITSFAMADSVNQPMERQNTKSWAEVDSLAFWNPEQGLDSVEVLYKVAKASSNAKQLLKCIIYKTMILAKLKSGDLPNTIERLANEMNDAPFPVGPVLHSMLAECYWHYYVTNRWRFFKRAVDAPVDDADILTWDLHTILGKARDEYELSLKEPEKLKNVRIDFFDAVLTGSKQGTRFRPTLFDFLAHRAVEFFNIDDNELVRPQGQWAIDDTSYFAPFKEFIRLDFASKDTASTKIRALRIFQELIAFHAAAKDTEALIDADLGRLAFVRNHSILANKDSLYLNALVSLETNGPYTPALTNITYAVASEYQRLCDSSTIQVREAFRWMNKKALDECRRAAVFPDAFGGRRCGVLATCIQAPDLTSCVEYVNMPDRPFKALVTFRNLTRCYWRIFPVSAYSYRSKTYNNVAEWMTLADIYRYLDKEKPAPLKEWATDLPDQGDYRNHSLEVKMPPLPLGHYIILCCSEPKFTRISDIVTFATTQVSGLGTIERRTTEGDYEFHVISRETGAPVAQAKVNIWTANYNFTNSTFDYTLALTSTTNADGFVCISPIREKNLHGGYFEFVNGNDSLHRMPVYYFFSTPKKTEARTLNTFLFTDRSMYRPGQTVFFKGVAYWAEADSFTAAPKETTTVKLIGTNQQEALRLTLVTNEFGSVQGSFVLPTNSLNGEMHIVSGNGSAVFSVEEYKLPRFLVIADTFKGANRLGDTMVFTGKAVAYAGPPVNRAKVRYRVMRTLRMSENWWEWGQWPHSIGAEISRGSTETDDKGEYSIPFCAVADPTIPKRRNPQFVFTITVEVSDVTAETRSVKDSIVLGDAGLALQVGIPPRVDKKQPGAKVFTITTANLTGAFQPARGNITVYRLQGPPKALRNRLWAAPDIFTWTKQQHDSLFPVDQYSRDVDFETWPMQDTVFNSRFDTQKNRKLAIPSMKNWKSGVYLIEASTCDSLGRQVDDRRFFTLFSQTDSKPPVPCADWFYLVNNRCEPGEKAVVVIGSGFEKTAVLIEIECKGDIIGRQWRFLKNSQQRVEIPVEERHRGNFTINCTFLSNGRFFRQSALVTVPWTNKDLNISFETFRSRLSPGEKERWRMRIMGKHGRKVDAEMAAVLYDASLDGLKPHSWNFPIRHNYGSAVPQIYRNINADFDTGQTNGSNFIFYSLPQIQADSNPTLNWLECGYGNNPCGTDMNSQFLVGACALFLHAQFLHGYPYRQTVQGSIRPFPG